MKTALPLDLWSERDLSSAVVDLARLGGWRRFHTFDSRKSNKGFPDWVFVKDGRLLFAELKSDTGKLRPEQEEWLESLRAVPGVEVHVWRPRDLEEIAKTLTGKRPREEQAA